MQEFKNSPNPLVAAKDGPKAVAGVQVKADAGTQGNSARHWMEVLTVETQLILARWADPQRRGALLWQGVITA